MPEDLTALDDKQLMRVFAREVAWQNFFASKLSEAQVVEKYAEAAHRTAEVRALLAQEVESGRSAPRTGERAFELKGKRDLDPDVMAASTEAIEAWARRKAYEAAYEARERCAALYSRELTRRTGGLATERRNMRWTP